MILDTIKVLPPALAIGLVALAISFLVTIVYKFTTNQKLMKALHIEMKELRGQIKGTKDTSQVADLNKKLMEKTFTQITHSMKSTIITLVPVFLIFGWLHANVAYQEISPGEEFTAQMELAEGGTATISSETLEITSEKEQEITEGKASWTLKGPEGEHEILFNYGDETYRMRAVVTNDWNYADPTLEKENKLFGIVNIGDSNPIKQGSEIQKISLLLEPVHPLGITLFGWQPGWLATYFIFMLGLTYPIRRILKVH